MLNRNSTRLLSLFALVFAFSLSQAQSILPPRFLVSFACPRDGFTEFGVNIEYGSPGFADPNEFSVELSDADGNFDDANPVVIASGINNENVTIPSGGANEGFNTPTTLPAGLYGDNYKIRVRSTNPATVSPPSTVGIPIYYTTMLDMTILVDGEDNNSYVICGGESLTMVLDNNSFALYQWFRNFAPYNPDGSTDPTGNTITVSESGNYYASVYYGPCTDSADAKSRLVSVSISPTSVTASITEASQNICPGDALTLNANPVDPTHTYTWYQDNVAVASGVGLSAYTVSATTPFGDYTVEIETADGCSDISDAITINNAGTTITVSTSSATEQILLPGNSTTLSVASSEAGSTVEWFMNGGMTAVSYDFDYVVSTSGVYQATVTGVGACADVKQSPEFNIYAPESYAVTIAPNAAYVDCGSDPATVSVTEIIASANAGSINLAVNSSDLASFTYQWYRDGSILAGETTSSTIANDRTANGNYTVDASFSGLTGNSNSVSIGLGLEALTISSALDKLCPNSSDSINIVYSDPLNPLYAYQWLKDGVAIPGETSDTYAASTVGSYEFVATAFGCTSTSNAIVISNFDVDSVVVSPSEYVTIAEGASQIVTASGADSYVWTNDISGQITNGDTITVTEEGTFTLVATVGNCSVTKIITVEFNLSGLIPNVITPNADNINDTWKLPGGFNSDRVEIIIYDRSGATVLQTKNYNNNWPSSTLNITKDSPIFYYVISKDNIPVKKGTISVLQQQ